MNHLDTAYNMGKEAALSDIAKNILEHVKAAPKGAVNIARGGLEHLKNIPITTLEAVSENTPLLGSILGAGAGGAIGYAGSGGDAMSGIGGAVAGGLVGMGGGHMARRIGHGM